MVTPQWMSMADPIHGMIRLRRHQPSHRMVLDVMNSRAMQRLRRIRQMGMAEFVFPGATHNRFIHSIGATWLMSKTIDHFMEFEETRSILQSPFADTRIPIERLLLLSILVHDIGHTPLSHTLEDILDMRSQGLLHDAYWNKLILRQDEELQRIWNRYDPQFPDAIARFNGWEPGTEPHFMADLVSSQLDMDRLDYLLRDSHYLGVQYGRIETDRIITNLLVGMAPSGKQVIAIREEAIPAVEHYLFGRYEAYKMAIHSLDKASETLLKKTLERFRWVRDRGIDPGHPADLLYKLMRSGRFLTVDEYLMLDDCYLWDKVNLWARYSQDFLLRQLANRLLGHDLFKYVEINHYSEELDSDSLSAVLEEVAAYYASRSLSFEFGFDRMIVAPKPLYQASAVKPPIWIKRKNGELSDFAEVSTLLSHQEEIRRGRRHLFFVWDREARHELQSILQRHINRSAVVNDNAP